MEMDEKIEYAVKHTEILRPPKQTLATFGATNIGYYMVTELLERASVVREGRVIVERPRIVTPTYLVGLEGFSEQARRFIDFMAQKNPHEPGLFYRYKNEPKDFNIVSNPLEEVIQRLNQEIDRKGDPLSAIIKGVEELWDVSLLKFTYEITRGSLRSNITEMAGRGLLDMDEAGTPRDARYRIEELFEEVEREPSRAPELVMELRRWRLFNEYEDRFLRLFKGR
jgi:hypothetical protein